MNRLIGLLITSFLCSSPLLASKYPNPVGYVNDFADILSEDQEQGMERRLSEYESQTEIEIAVVTVKSLEGDSVESWTMGLAQEWKVGKAGADNGVIYVIAPNERRMRIEVGLGLESDLPDGKCGRIRDKYCLPYFKEGKYAQGIEQTVNALISTLGNMTPEQRVEARKLRREEAERKRLVAAAARRDFMIKLEIFLGISAFVGAIIFCGYRIRKSIREVFRKKDLRKEVSNGLVKQKKALQAFNKRILAVEKLNLPDWAKDERNHLMEEINQIRNEAEDYLVRINHSLPDQPDTSHSDLVKLSSLSVILDSHILEIEYFPEEVARYHQRSVELAKKIRNNVLPSLFSEVGSAYGNGFQIESFLQTLQLLRDEFSRIELKSGDWVPTQPGQKCNREIFNALKFIYQKLEGLGVNLRDWMNKRDKTETVLQSLSKRVDLLQRDLQKTIRTFDRLQEECHQDNWNGFLDPLQEAKEKLSTASDRIESIRQKNSMNVQNFVEASLELDSLNEDLDFCASVFQRIQERSFKISRAQKDYKRALSEAQKSVDRASLKVRERDVGSGAKRNATEAIKKLHEAQNLLNSESLINWLLVITLLTSAKSSAEQALRSAQSDVENAERRRRRLREEEERRQRQSSYDYGIGGSSFSSSSGGGFGGFGGGGFGGGGCSGGW